MRRSMPFWIVNPIRSSRDVSAGVREYEKISVDRAATFVRICEDDENSCDTCSDLGGYEGTYEQQMEVGWPGHRVVRRNKMPMCCSAG